jgi:hypothetical protein
LKARADLYTKAKGRLSPRHWAFFSVLIICFATIARAQDSVSTGSSTVPEGSISEQSSSPTSDESSAKPQADEAKPPAQPGNVLGTVLDQTGSVAPGASVRLATEDKSFSQEIDSGNNGQFSFSHVPPGPFKIVVNAEGFGDQTFAGELSPGQTLIVPPLVISIATVVTAVKVDVDPLEVATEEVKEEEHQRVFGFIPNFYVTYNHEAAPLTTKLKFHLAWKSSADPITIAGTAFLAGLQQAGDQYPEFGQGMEGFGKRLGAGYGDVLTSTFLSGAIFPSLLHQDPRYYFQGTGTTRSRLLHAVENSVRCKGDNGKWQVNYSNLLGVFGGAAVSSYLYPTNNRATFTLSAGLIRLGESSLAGVMQEFVVPKISKSARRAKQQTKEQPVSAEVSTLPSASNPDPQKP